MFIEYEQTHMAGYFIVNYFMYTVFNISQWHLKQ